MRLPSLDALSERRAGLLVILIGLLLYVPLAGSYGLYDPWETHYSEVARQMTERGDFISLWWPGAPIDPDHFWSKPVLSFWIMSLSFRLFGLAHAAPGVMALSTRPEWAARLPFCLLGVLGMYGLYLCTSRFVSRRAGVLAAVVAATSPLYALVSRQAMTDMAFVGPMTMALALGALALFDDEDVPLARRTARAREGDGQLADHPLFYLSVGLFALVALPQIIVDSIQLVWPIDLGRHRYVIPGAVVMIPYLAGFIAHFAIASRLRYKAPLYLSIAATLCGVATLAKGIAGLGLPVIVFIAYLGFTWNWRRLGRAQIGLGILLALLTCAVVAVPWHHAMLIRHGRPFWDELYGDNHWRRLMVGRHGDRGSFEYFLREVSYGILPWVAVAPAALATMVMRRFGGTTLTAVETRRQGMYWFGAIWFVAAYALVSLSVTKFHHYILPAIPGLAIVVGCFLDDLLSRRDGRAAAAVALLGIPLLALVSTIWLASRRTRSDSSGCSRTTTSTRRRGGPGRRRSTSGGASPCWLRWPGWPRSGSPGGGHSVWRWSGSVSPQSRFTYFLLDGYMMRVTPYWTQKGLIANYYKLRRSPEEKLLVWQMYWRGENFYTENEIYVGPHDERTVFLGDKNLENFKAWMQKHRGRRAFILVERARWSSVEAAVPPETRPSLKMVDESNMKFCLAQVDL